MNKVVKIIAVITVLITTVFITLVNYLDSMDWDYVSSKKSPNGRYGLYLYNYLSDGDTHAPYGQYIFFNPEYRVVNPNRSDVIFAGSCGENVGYSWVSNTEIKIVCPAQEIDSIRTRSERIFGIKVNLQSQ